MNFKKTNKRGKPTAFLSCMGPEPTLEQEYDNTQVTSPDELEIGSLAPLPQENLTQTKMRFRNIVSI